MTDPVQAQYEAYPYPARDPADEAERLITGSPSHLDEVNHYLFAGRRDFARPFRALAAGGGTGDAAIMMAQQLAERGGAGEVVYLDSSRAARDIAEARAAARGLSNIAFHTADLETLPGLGRGAFDSIDCCGVLHPLAVPAAGLARLAETLAPGGGLGVMLYGTYGRTGLYPVQALLREIAGDLPLAERVGLARRLLGALPATNWLKRNPFLGDHQRSDAELVDLLLHARDRAYALPELFALFDGAGLAETGLIEPARYEPATYVKDPALLERLAALSWRSRAACAETLAGNMKRHIAYLVRRDDSAGDPPEARVARPASPDAVPLLHGIEALDLAKTLSRELVLTNDFDGLKLRFPVPRLAPAAVVRIDGRTSLGAIHAALQSHDPSLTWDGFKAQFDQLYGVLNGVNALLIAHPSSSGT